MGTERGGEPQNGFEQQIVARQTLTLCLVPKVAEAIRSLSPSLV